MDDLYLYDDVPVLRNLLDIKDEKALDLVEAEQSRMSMILLYAEGFDDFTPAGIKRIHEYLFKDIYEWAGEYRKINIQKREQILAGVSVWYSNSEDIPRDLKHAFSALNAVKWETLSREDFVREVCNKFPRIWQAHPFREGNTRTIVMMLTFFVEHYGYYMDQELLAANAGYVRNAFVLASLGKYSEFEHLEKIMMDAVSDEPIEYSDELDEDTPLPDKSGKYQKNRYQPQPHEQGTDHYDPKYK